MNDETRELIATCEKRGVDWARVHVPGLGSSDAAIAARHWIAEQERIERVASDAQQEGIARSAISAAKAAADAARWAKWAAIATAIGAAAAVVQAIRGS